MKPPPPYEERLDPRAHVWCLPEARGWVEVALGAAGSLYDAAEADLDSILLEGRGPAHAVQATDDQRWVVRHYRRGGRIAALLGDRYARVGPPRPFRELITGVEVAERGVATPEIVAAAVYPAGPFYRGDLVTRYLGHTRDLADVLFGPTPIRDRSASEIRPLPFDRPARTDLLHAAGAFVQTLARAGVRHSDLNAKNVLVGLEPDHGTLFLHVLDLDHCSIVGGEVRDGGATMYARLARSLRKLSRRRGVTLGSQDWDAFATGFGIVL